MSKRLSRRQFIGASAGVAAAASLGGATAALGRKEKGGTPTVPPDFLGIQQFSIRDATSRALYDPVDNPDNVGYLGGPNYPEDPTDLGPLMPLPSGFAQVFEFLASCSIKGIEFYTSNQSSSILGRQPTPAEKRQYLDDAGLICMGTHQYNGSRYDLDTDTLTTTGQELLDEYQTMGAQMLGFSGNLSNLGQLADSGSTLGFARAAERINKLGALLKGEGIQYYYHPEQDNYRYFFDPDHPELDTVHRIQWVLDNTERDLFKLELDYLHNYSGRARFRNAAGQMDIDIFRMVNRDPKRLIGFHLKDGFVNDNWVVGDPVTGNGSSGGSPYNQTFLRTPTFTDAVIPIEGDLGQGTGFDTSNPGMKKFMEKPKGRYGNVLPNGDGRYVMIESDSGPGPTSGASEDRGRSLRHAKGSAKLLLAMRE